VPRNFWRIFLVVLGAGVLAFLPAACNSETETAAPARENTYLFCFWNVENLFDDHYDGRENRADKEYDRWFADDPQILQLKLEHLSEALMKLNQGRGPDILALAEVESVRAAELFRAALNRRLSDPSLHYTNVLMKDLSAGRHIAPAIITRLPVQRDRTRLHGSRLRILEGHVKVSNHDLVVIASHWTSRLTDKEGAGNERTGRAKYGDQIYGLFRGMHKSNPQVDLLICGDFNDDPWDSSVTEHLHATSSMEEARSGALLDLFADREPEAGFGTHFYGGMWHIFDQIVISPGLLDDLGWSCKTESVHTVNTLCNPHDRRHRPWRFGNEHDKAPRGYSDHFPVTVQLKVFP
jgi:endonuclease/exonuclease/phosphatase family metal-dependent hydrolase